MTKTLSNKINHPEMYTRSSVHLFAHFHYQPSSSTDFNRRVRLGKKNYLKMSLSLSKTIFFFFKYTITSYFSPSRKQT